MKKQMALIVALIWLLVPACAESILGEWFKSPGCLRVIFPREAAGKRMDVALSLPNGGVVLNQSVILPLGETSVDMPLYDMAFTWTKGEAAANDLFIAYESDDNSSPPLAVFLKEGAPGTAHIALEAGHSKLSASLSSLAAADVYRPLRVTDKIGTFVPRVNGNVRREPSAAAERIGMAHALEEYACFERTDANWLLIELPGAVRGYISGNLGELLKLSTLLDARALREQGRFALAAQSYDELLYPLAAQTLRQWDALNRGDIHLGRGDYLDARQQYLAAGELGDAAAKARALEGATPYPDDAVLFIEDYEDGTCEILIKAEDKQHARFVKIVDDAGSPVARLFLKPAGECSIAVRPGKYRLSHAAGTIWYGEDLAFGPQGLYARVEQDLILDAPALRMTISLASREKTNIQTETIGWRDF